MKFAYNPGETWDKPDGPPRIIRYVEHGSLPPNVLCVLDAETNVLFVDKSLLERLPELERAIVLKTHRVSIEVEFDRGATKFAA